MSGSAALCASSRQRMPSAVAETEGRSGASTDALTLNIARGVQGLGGAIMFATALALISQEFHGRERGTAFGLWGAFHYFLGSFGLVDVGLALFSAIVLFQLVTLPVEFDASHRAIVALEGGGLLGAEELSGARKVLQAAALTYIAALAASIGQLIYFFIASRR